MDFALDELQLICGICNRYILFLGGKREEVMDLLILVQVRYGCPFQPGDHRLGLGWDLASSVTSLKRVEVVALLLMAHVSLPLLRDRVCQDPRR